MKVGDSLRIRHPNRRVKKTSDQASDKGLWPSERVHTEAWHYFLKWKRSGWVCNVCLWTQWLLVWSVSALLIWSRHLKKKITCGFLLLLLLLRLPVLLRFQTTVSTSRWLSWWPQGRQCSDHLVTPAACLGNTAHTHTGAHMSMHTHTHTNPHPHNVPTDQKCNDCKIRWKRSVKMQVHAQLSYRSIM